MPSNASKPSVAEKRDTVPSPARDTSWNQTSPAPGRRPSRFVNGRISFAAPSAGWKPVCWTTWSGVSTPPLNTTVTWPVTAGTNAVGPVKFRSASSALPSTGPPVGGSASKPDPKSTNS